MSNPKLAVQDKLHTPSAGVRLTGGLLKTVFDNNIAYLKSLSMDSILYWYRHKSKLPTPGEPFRGFFEDEIKGQAAGLFLMGAGNTLCWHEDSELRDRVNAIVDSIDRNKESDGYFMAIPKSEFGTGEYPNYVRSWLTHGLIAAAKVGNEKAMSLVRGMQTWFNRCDERVFAKNLSIGYQGMIANTNVYLSEVGLPEDLDTAIDCYQENWRLAQFITGSVKGRDTAVHMRPDEAHGYELTAIEAYMDLYRITGKPMYLNAVDGAHRLYKKKWQHVGGGIVMIELTEVYPGCYWLNPAHPYNELCCSVFWIYLNQRYHHLFPDEEHYVAEIEKSIFNIAVANQKGQEHIRYHAYLDLLKDGHRAPVTCCAGKGTRLYGSLPEFLYSLAPDGVYVDIYASSELDWDCDGVAVTLHTQTDIPIGNEVRIKVSLSSPRRFVLKLRIPGWTSSPVEIHLNGEAVATGEPGTYCAVERTWCDGDTVSFALPRDFVVTRYTGGDALPNFERYATEYGGLLLGVVGGLEHQGQYIKIDHDPDDPRSWLTPVPGKPLHFAVKDMPGYEYVPYYEIQDQAFTCYPVFPGNR